MARRRYQDPTPKKHGEWWTIRVREDEFVAGQLVRRNKRVRLGQVATTTKREAAKLAAEHLRPMNQGLEPIGSAITFEDFVTKTWLTVDVKYYASTTRGRYEGIVQNYLIPKFGRLPLRNLTTQTLRAYFAQANEDDQLKVLSHESVDKIRDVLSVILGSAKEYKLLLANPMEDVRALPDKNGRVHRKPFLSPQQFALLLSFVAEPYASMIYVAIYTGLRVSELIGLRWEDVLENAITIDERYCRGDLARPKSEASCATIAVNKCVIERIHRLKQLTVQGRCGGQGAVRTYRIVKKDTPIDLVFQSVRTGVAMRDNNILSRHLKPAGRKLGMEWVNWLVLRRSHSNWLRLAGADLKDRQAQMRHAHPQTTADVYDQFVPENQLRVVEKLSRLMEVVQ